MGASDPPISESLRASFDACRDITRRRAANFYYGIRLTPQPKRDAIYSVYAWTRRADDLADGRAGVEKRRASVTRWRALTHDAFTHANVADAAPIWPAFIDTARRYTLDASWCDALMDGMLEDLDHRGYDTMRHLESYTYKVASTVGLICMKIWGLQPGAVAAHAHQCAVDRGTAFQLTNILRDVGRDSTGSSPRLYIPRELLASHQLTRESLLTWSNPAACDACIRAVIARAHAAYESSRPLDGMIEPACLGSLRGMTRVYERVLSLIDADPRRSVSLTPVSLPLREKLALALAAVTGGMTS